MKKLIFISFIALTIFTFSCKKDNGGMHTIKYTVQGTNNSNVTYTDASGNTQSATNVSSSWTYSFSSSNHGMALNLTAVSSDASQIGGKIFIDGVQTAQENGATGNVSISAMLP